MIILFTVINLLFVLSLSYIAGSFPTSIIAGKLLKGIDIRKYGSGNAGGTNSFRVLGWKAGIVVVAIDIFKGFAATMWISNITLFGNSYHLGMLVPVLAGAVAVLGHCYTVFAGFKGGKGVAASAGMIIALSPTTFLICFAVFSVVLVSSGYVSLSSLVTALALPVTLCIYRLVFYKPISIYFLAFSVIIFLFIFFSHRTNIKRLIKGTENRFNKIWIFAKNKRGF